MLYTHVNSVEWVACLCWLLLKPQWQLKPALELRFVSVGVFPTKIGFWNTWLSTTGKWMLKASTSTSSEWFEMNKLQPPRVVPIVSWEQETRFCWGEIWVNVRNGGKVWLEICYAITVCNIHTMFSWRNLHMCHFQFDSTYFKDEEFTSNLKAPSSSIDKVT